MIRRKLEELTIIPLKTNETQISVDEVLVALKDKPSDTVYITYKKELYGIVTPGDISRCKNGVVTINQNFTYLTNWNYIEARKIFKDKEIIHKIPVVDDNRKLIGDYSRWDEKRQWSSENNTYAEYNLEVQNIYLVEPKIAKKELFFEREKEYFHKNNIEYSLCNLDTIPLYYNGNKFIFIDEDELRGAMSIYQNLDSTYKFFTYKTFIQYPKLSVILKYLQTKGITTYTLSCRSTGSVYEKEYKKTIEERNKIIKGERTDLIPEEFAKDFLGDLYTEEYYKTLNSDLKLEICYDDGVVKFKDVSRKYCNFIEGARVTVAQPSNYKKTIYFFGPCIMRGSRVEDKYTIESFLQEKLNAIGEYRVVNFASINDINIEIDRIIETNYNEGDIAVIYSYSDCFSSVPDLNIWEIAEKYKIPAEWSTDHLIHCNHRVNQLIAKEIFSMLQSELGVKSEKKQCQLVKLDKKEYIIKSYINKYFSDFDYTNYDKIGSIVMNCNPFTKGHRYLIEKACEMVDFLIVFVVEEDESFFSFEKRFEMVKKGTSDLKKVLVVPSGNFILSKTTFPEYFIKLEDEDLRKNVDYDITLFADHIASQLKITCRFVGEEPYDVVTNEYNNAMKRILPKKGIEVIEIPRKEENGVCISASTVRKYLENDELELAYRFVPETTKKILEGF